MYSIFLALWGIIGRKRQVQLFFTLLLSFLVAVFDALGVGLIGPFILLMAKIGTPGVESTSYFYAICVYFGIQPNSAALALTIFILFSLVIGSILKVLLLWYSARTSFQIGSELSSYAYKRILNLPYEEHITKNSTNFVSLIVSKMHAVIAFLQMTINIISSIFILIFVTSMLMWISPMISSSLLILFAIIYGLIVKFSKHKLNSSSKFIATETRNSHRILDEGIKSIREVILGGWQNYFVKYYSESDLKLRTTEGINTFLSNSPKPIIEGIGFVVIISLAYFASLRAIEGEKVLVALATIALSAQKILPAFQQIYASINKIRSIRHSVNEVLKFIKNSKFGAKPDSKKIVFDKSIKFIDVGYKYPNYDEYVFQGATFSISRGACVAILGESGSGKSTLVDILMGLLPPTRGAVKVDESVLSEWLVPAWMTHISHVPQKLFFLDSSYALNVAFGSENSMLDYSRIDNVTKISLLDSLVRGWPKKYDENLGENAVKLSGGQAQRLGIARALYQDKSVIIFDEATSALDEITEMQLIKNIMANKGDKTYFFITHRPYIMNYCDTVLRIVDGVVSIEKT
jgi:ABC-type bacteriocin/lantibiotic exporter with double-glycine peptidase domain